MQREGKNQSHAMHLTRHPAYVNNYPIFKDPPTRMHSLSSQTGACSNRFLKADPEGCQPREVCLFNCATVVAITTSTLASHVAGLTKRIRSRRRSLNPPANSFQWLPEILHWWPPPKQNRKLFHLGSCIETTGRRWPSIRAALRVSVSRKCVLAVRHDANVKKRAPSLATFHRARCGHADVRQPTQPLCVMAIRPPARGSSGADWSQETR